MVVRVWIWNLMTKKSYRILAINSVCMNNSGKLAEYSKGRVSNWISSQLTLVEENMSSGRSLKRIAGAGDDHEGIKNKTRTRRAIKIAVEKEEDEDDTSSKYFQKEDISLTLNEDANVVKIEAVKEELSIGNPSGDASIGSVKTVKKKEQTSPAKKTPKVTPVKVEPPKDWEVILENIKVMRSSKTAAIDTMGCERTADLKEEPKVQRFQTLVSLMLSSQTKDQVTFAAMERLKERDLTVQAMLDIDETELGEIIKPVGFYKRKALYIKKTSAVLREKYKDDIPKTVNDLCDLSGVGPKMAYICMNAAWGENAGIGVDTHVHRISNRLKWTGKNGTSTPEKTREALESWMPKDLWQEFNILLVGFGQETCLPIGPKCESCLNKNICPASTVPKSKKKKKE